jgi:hypothetical protein
VHDAVVVPVRLLHVPARVHLGSPSLSGAVAHPRRTMQDVQDVQGVQGVQGVHSEKPRRTEGQRVEESMHVRTRGQIGQWFCADGASLRARRRHPPRGATDTGELDFVELRRMRTWGKQDDTGLFRCTTITNP